MTRVLRIAFPLALVATLAFAGAASAHPHKASPGQGGDGQVLANGTTHPRFINGVSCWEYGKASTDPAPLGNAWYGLETAHHGPDSGTRGKADGCYQIDGLVPGEDDQNPAID